VSVKTFDGHSATLQVVLGDAHAPCEGVEFSDLSGITSLTVDYPREKHAFFTPLTKMGIGWDFGWLGVYLLAYLPTMAATRWIVKPV
jgi:hypothetical protein